MVEIGQTVKMGYFSQENEAMDESLKVIDYIKNAAEKRKDKRTGASAPARCWSGFYFPSHIQYTAMLQAVRG